MPAPPGSGTLRVPLRGICLGLSRALGCRVSPARSQTAPITSRASSLRMAVVRAWPPGCRVALVALVRVPPDQPVVPRLAHHQPLDVRAQQLGRPPRQRAGLEGERHPVAPERRNAGDQVLGGGREPRGPRLAAIGAQRGQYGRAAMEVQCGVDGVVASIHDL